MFVNIEFNEAAFKHEITEVNIRYALKHPLHEQLLEQYTNKWLVIGYDIRGTKGKNDRRRSGLLGRILY